MLSAGFKPGYFPGSDMIAGDHSSAHALARVSLVIFDDLEMHY
jgi:hypothetical protein